VQAGTFPATVVCPATFKVGALMLAAGHALMFFVVGQSALASIGGIAVALLVQGSGLGMVMAPLVARVLAGMPAACAGVASGALATVQQVGNALGVALIGIVFYGADGAMTSQGSAQGFGRSLIYLFVLAIGVLVFYNRFGQVAALKEDNK